MSDRPSGILFIPLYSLNVILHGFLCLRGYHGVSGIRLVGNVFADDKMHAGSFFLHAGRPDISAVILDDLADDGEADPAPSTGGIAGGIGAVKAVKDFGQVAGGNALAVVLDLDADAVVLIEDAEIDPALLFIHIFYTISHNIVNDTFHLLGIRDDHGLRRDKIRVIELEAAGFHVHADLLDTVAEIISDIDPVEIVGDAVALKAGVEGQLIDQAVHVVGLVVDREYILFLLLRCVGDPVDQAFDITLDRCDRGLEVMGNIADQLPVLLLPLQLLVRSSPISPSSPVDRV